MVKVRKIGFTAGAFDLLHVGHIFMFKEAKNICDYLIVALHIDPSIERPKKNKPIQSVFERRIQLMACKYVDKVILYSREKDLKRLLETLRIDVRIIGEDHKGKPITGDDICQKRGIKVYYNSRSHHYSTSELRKRIKNG